MKNSKITYILVILLVFASIQSTAATSVFLTSDHIGTNSNDNQMLEEIKQFIEELSDNTITVQVDPESPSPGEGSRAVESGCDVSVNFAAVDCGNFQVLARGSVESDKQVIFVNVGNLNLNNKSFIKRAWDDNYSPTSFAGIQNPAEFLSDAGIRYIQPLQEYPGSNIDGLYSRSDTDVNRYIAGEVIDAINSYDNTQNKRYDQNLIMTHRLAPQNMGEASRQLLDSGRETFNETYNGYTAAQLLYLTSSYLNGSPLEEPGEYEQPHNPLEYSVFTKDSYSYYDYVQMGSITREYMNQNKQAPDYIEYNGAYIGYYDLLYNFAKITQNHTINRKMDFSRNYDFTKVHSSLLITIAPVAVAGLIILTALYALKTIFKRKRRRR